MPNPEASNPEDPEDEDPEVAALIAALLSDASSFRF